jgi:hypothetical protein
MLEAAEVPAARDCFELLAACRMQTVVRLGKRTAQNLPTGRAGRLDAATVLHGLSSLSSCPCSDDAPARTTATARPTSPT